LAAYRPTNGSHPAPKWELRSKALFADINSEFSMHGQKISKIKKYPLLSKKTLDERGEKKEQLRIDNDVGG
jgi:hypothetical protein